MSAKELLNKFYFFFFGPVYRRLSRDVSLKIQDLARAQLEFQDRWSAIISDELIATSLRANSQPTDLADPRIYTPADIIETAGRIHKSQDLVALSRQLGIPLNDLAQIYIKYSDVSASGVVRLLAMEQELSRTQALLDKYEHPVPVGTAAASPFEQPRPSSIGVLPALSDVPDAAHT